MDKLIFLVYARKSSRSNWNNYNRTDNKDFAHLQAHKLYDDCKADNFHNWEIRIVTIYDSILWGIYDGVIPDNLKFNIYWLDLHMIPFLDMQTKPDQTIYNGGN